MAKRNKFTKVNPSAVVMIYNYRDRLGTANINADAQEIDQIILTTTSLKSVSTSKSKSQPNGTFEIQLAPWKNWTSAITPGSWCVILMGRTPIKTSETKYGTPKVDKRHFKMLGRIESVRCATAVDQTTGALSTTYVVTGTDWGSMFNSFLYVDPASRTLENSAIGTANRLFYDQLVTVDGKTNKEINLYDSMAAVRSLMAFWGASDPRTDALLDATDQKVLSKAVNMFGMPKELVDYMGFIDLSGKPNQLIASLIRTRGNVLLDYDVYSSVDGIGDQEHTDGIGYIEPSSIFGMHTLWQLMTDNCNKPLNELISEIRWEGDQPHLTVYKRVKPFKIRSFDEIKSDNVSTEDDAGAAMATDYLQKQCSDFKNVRRHQIPSEEIIAVNAGTNWRDRFNFIEVLLGKQIIPAFQNKDMASLANKVNSQFYDHKSIQRDGLLPLTMTINYLPPSTSADRVFDLDKIFAYKYLGKEWYFDTHKMLNGVVTMIGQDNYIQVGDNIMFKANVLSSNFNTSYDSLHGDNVWMTAHVESIAHRAVVDDAGARSFITEIQFVRGIITNENADRISSTAEMTLDQDTTMLSEFEERNSDRVIGTSSGIKGKQDPDQMKTGHPGAS